MKKRNNLLVVEWNVDGEKKSLSFTPSTLEHVIISGEHSVSTGAMRLFFEENVSFSCLDKSGYPLGFLFPHRRCMHVDVWEKQLMMNEVDALRIAKTICIAAAKNKMSLLRSLQRSRDIDLEVFIKNVNDVIKNMHDADDTSSLMGYEGNSSRIYFDAYRKMIPAEFGFENRVRHPSPDPVNVMLNYGYGILYSKVRMGLIQVNLNPYRGVLHASYRDQEALVYDLIEEFRQPVVDKTVLTLIGRKQVSPGSFSIEGEMCMMDDHFKKEFADHILTRLESKTKYDDSTESFQVIIDLQARRLRDAIMNCEDYAPFVYRGR